MKVLFLLVSQWVIMVLAIGLLYFSIDIPKDIPNLFVGGLVGLVHGIAIFSLQSWCINNNSFASQFIRFHSTSRLLIVFGLIMQFFLQDTILEIIMAGWICGYLIIASIHETCSLLRD